MGRIWMFLWIAFCLNLVKNFQEYLMQLKNLFEK